MTLIVVTVCIAFCMQFGLIIWLLLQQKQAVASVISVSFKGMELLKASSLEQFAQVEAIRGREQLYQRQLEDAVAGKQIPLPKSEKSSELVEVIDDSGRARTIDMNKLQSIGPDDMLSFS